MPHRNKQTRTSLSRTKTGLSVQELPSSRKSRRRGRHRELEDPPSTWIDVSSRAQPNFVASLPDEIILEIFHFCIASLGAVFDFTRIHPEATTNHDLTDLRSSPLNISQVCARWRRVALSSTSLWSIVVLRTDLLLPRHFVALDLWLSRSKSKSTLLAISLTIRDKQQSNTVALSFFKQLTFQKKRLRTLHLHLNFRLSESMDLSIFSGPALEELVICSWYPTFVPLALMRCPRLRHLKLYGGSDFSCRSLENLQHLELDLLALPADFLGLLGRLPCLESLNIAFTCWISPVPSNTAHQSLQRLRSLNLRSGFTVVESYFTFLGRLFEVAPSLSDLQLSFPKIHPSTSLQWRQLISITEQHKPPLERLSLKDESDTDRAETDSPEAGFLATLLQHTPNLTSLSSNFGTSEKFVRAMTLQSTTDLNLCPRLEEVHFGRFSGEVTAHCLVNMIVSRVNTGEKALKKVRLTPFHYHDISRRRVIKMSMSRGLQLTTMTR